MRLLGLDAVTLTITLALLAALLVALHLSRRPARRVAVPSLALWAALLPEQSRASAARARPRSLAALLLALLIATSLALSLGDLELAPERAPRTLLLLVDCSASMAARDVLPSRLAQAKVSARALLRTLGARDRALIASFADRFVPLTPFSSDRQLLEAALDGITVQPRAAELGRATELALALLEGQPRPELLLLSDGAVAGQTRAEELVARRRGLTVRHERVGRSGRNLAVSQLSTRRYPLDKRHHEGLLSVSNFGPDDESLTVRLHSGERILYEQQWQVAKGATETRALIDLPTAEGNLSARLLPSRGADALASDDVAELRVVARRRARVLVVTRGNRYLEAALLLDDYLEVTEISPEQYGGALGHDAVIFDGFVPPAAPERPALYLGPPASDGFFPRPRSGLVERPYFERVDAQDPLVLGLALRDVNVARAVRVSTARGDLAVAAAADGVPLLLRGGREDGRFVALTFDLRESDLPLRPAWPLLLLRALDLLVAEPSAISSAPPLPGSEAAIAPQTLFARARTAPAPERQDTRSSSRIWPQLLLLALLLLLLEWLAFHRRWTQ